MNQKRKKSSSILEEQKLPLILEFPFTETSLREESETDLASFLGRSYDPILGISHSTENYKRPIIDVHRLHDDSPYLFDFIPMKQTTSRYCSFTNTSSFEEKIKKNFELSVSAKVSYMKYFSMGAKYSMKKNFGTEIGVDEKSIYGILSIDYDYGKEWLSTDLFSKESIKWNYLTRVFLGNLYGNPLSKTFSRDFGLFLTPEIITGVKAEGLFYGETEFISSKENREKSMSAAMSMSAKIPIGVGTKIKGEMGFSLDQDQKDALGFKSLKIVARTYGGGISQSFSAPSEIDKLTINFAPWLSTIKGPKDYTITHIAKYEPVSDYIIGDNLVKLLNAGKLQDKMTEPQIHITIGAYNCRLNCIPADSNKLYVTLLTRFGDEVLLRPIHSNDDEWWTIHNEFEYFSKSAKVAKVLSERYRLPIHREFFEDFQRQYRTRNLEIDESLLFSDFISVKTQLYGLDELKMKKYHHKLYNMDFLIYDGGKGHRYAYLIFNKKLIGTYGLEDIYKKASTIEFEEGILPDDYVIIAL